MKKFTLIIAIIILVIIVVFYFAFKNTNKSAGNTNQLGYDSILLFVATGCPHCTKVKDYIIANDLKNKLPIEERETRYNKTNSDLLKQKASECQIPESQIGVPFLYFRGKCLMGDEPIIAFFQKIIQ